MQYRKLYISHKDTTRKWCFSAGRKHERQMLLLWLHRELLGEMAWGRILRFAREARTVEKEERQRGVDRPWEGVPLQQASSWNDAESESRLLPGSTFAPIPAASIMKEEQQKRIDILSAAVKQKKTKTMFELDKERKGKRKGNTNSKASVVNLHQWGWAVLGKISNKKVYSVPFCRKAYKYDF